MTTNPEWVWCSADHRGRDVRIDAWPYVKGEGWRSIPTEGVAPPVVYVRRDIAAAEVAALRAERDALRATILEAVKGFQMAEEADDPGRSNDFLNETIADFRKAALAANGGST